MISQSITDLAFQRFKELINNRALFRFDDPLLSEADTRAKFIDPLFREILGWSEPEIRREKPCTSGYADYLLGLDASYILIEAKRSKPRFHLECPSKARKLHLSGPHLLGMRLMKEPIEQAQRYASDLGAHFAILTNGSQLILFKPYLPGRSWTTGTAIVWHNHEDILGDFAQFYNLLSRDSVCAGILFQEFAEIEGLCAPLYAPIGFVLDSHRELVRNPFWQKISRVVGPLFTDIAEDPTVQLEVIRHCYVTNPLSDESDRALDQRLRDTIPPYLSDAAIVDLTPGKVRKTTFGHNLEKDVVDRRPGTYILTGGVGSGKTTYLKRFALITNAEFVNHYCIWLHLDFLPFGNADIAELDSEIKRYVYANILKQIERIYPDRIPKDGEEIRKLFNLEVKKACITRLYGLKSGSSEWNLEIGKLVEQLCADPVEYVTALLRNLSGKGLRLVFVLDNTDQQGERFQERVFLLAQRMSSEHQALCIIALREEKFFAAYRRGIFDAFGDRRFHIGSPNLRDVIQRRLEYGREKFFDKSCEGETATNPCDLARIDLLLSVLIRATTKRNSDVVRMLSCVSNGDIRNALDMFREFLSSGNTNIQKILEIGKGYSVPFHEFAKSAILGAKKYYRGSVSPVVNVLKKSGIKNASHFTAIRILARLSASETMASSHGEGFCQTNIMLREYREAFGSAADFEEWAGELLRRGLIESEPPKVGDVKLTDALRISASGSYYWRYLIRSFVYLDLVYLDTPIESRDLALRLGGKAEHTDMVTRFSRVTAFSQYMAEKERQEVLEVKHGVRPYGIALMEDIHKQVQDEIRAIRSKSKKR